MTKTTEPEGNVKMKLTISAAHFAALEQFAIDNDLTRAGGVANISEAIRMTSAIGLKKKQLAQGVKVGNPDKHSKP